MWILPDEFAKNPLGPVPNPLGRGGQESNVQPDAQPAGTHAGHRIAARAATSRHCPRQSPSRPPPFALEKPSTFALGIICRRHGTASPATLIRPLLGAHARQANRSVKRELIQEDMGSRAARSGGNRAPLVSPGRTSPAGLWHHPNPSVTAIRVRLRRTGPNPQAPCQEVGVAHGPLRWPSWKSAPAKSNAMDYRSPIPACPAFRAPSGPLHPAPRGRTLVPPMFHRRTMTPPCLPALDARPEGSPAASPPAGLRPA